jgi:hypothetical protein
MVYQLEGAVDVKQLNEFFDVLLQRKTREIHCTLCRLQRKNKDLSKITVLFSTLFLCFLLTFTWVREVNSV